MQNTAFVTRLKTSTRDIDSSQAVPLEAQKVNFGAPEDSAEASKKDVLIA